MTIGNVKFCSVELTQGRGRQSGWSGMSQTNNLELNQLADQLNSLLSCNLWTIISHVATYILQMLLKMHDTSSYLVSQPNYTTRIVPPITLQYSTVFASFCTEMIVGSIRTVSRVLTFGIYHV